MMVSAARRILSAISFGVFWRLAPSTMAIIRSRKLSPGTGGDPNDEPIGEDLGASRDGAAIAAALPNDRRAFAGDGAFIDRGDAFDDFSVGRNEIAGFDKDDIAFLQLIR